jgi:hypothetical protein
MYIEPVRLEMVRRLKNAGVPLKCSVLYDGINKSTAIHHFNVLREAGPAYWIRLWRAPTRRSGTGSTHVYLHITLRKSVVI